MTLLNFPSDPASVDNIYVGPNGVRYIFDGVKWVGQSAGGGGISTQLVSGSHNVAIAPDGSIQFPYFTFPSTDGANGQVLKTNGSGVLTWTSDSTTTYRLYNTNLTNPSQHYTLEVDTNGVVVLPDRSIINGSTLRGIYGTGEANFTGITIGPDAGHQEESWVWVDPSGAHIATRYSGEISAAKQWDFNNSGDFIIPTGGHIKYQDGSPYSASAANTGNIEFNDTTMSTVPPINTGDGKTITITAGDTSQFSHVGGNIILQAGNGHVPTTGFDGNVQIQTAGGTWTFDQDASLTVPGDINVGAGANPDQGHIYIDGNLNGNTSIRWISSEPGSNSMFRFFKDSRNTLSNERLRSGMYDDDFFITTTSNADGVGVQDGDDHTFTFASDGDLKVPGEVRNKNGYRAVWENELPADVAQLVAMLQGMNTSAPDTNWDGGAASSIYEVSTNADGGFSSTRWGRNTTRFDGGASNEEYTLTLNGGGA